jgi:hypothetical protein
MMKVIVVFLSVYYRVGTTNMAAIYSNGGNRWNILGFNFTKRDALSSLYKIFTKITDTVVISFVFSSCIINEVLKMFDWLHFL